MRRARARLTQRWGEPLAKDLTSRKNVRLIGYDYSSAGCYFVTLCVKDKREMLGDVVGDAPLRVPHCVLSDYGAFVDEVICRIPNVYSHVCVDKYVIMPNHVHMIVHVTGGTRSGAPPTKAVVPQIVQSLKSMTTKQFGFSMWQRSYHDHIIRDDTEYQRIWQYIDENPSCWVEDDYYMK